MVKCRYKIERPFIIEVNQSFFVNFQMFNVSLLTDHFVLSNGGALSVEASYLNGANSMCAIVYGRGGKMLTFYAKDGSL